jgi:hypothetical protein
MKRLMDDGTYQDVDPATFGIVVPLQKARRLDDTGEWHAMGVQPPAPLRRNWWPLAVAVFCAATWIAVIWWVSR